MLLAQPTDMIARFDVRLLSQLCNDTNSPVSSTGLLTDPNLNAALEDASGVVLSALYTSYKYQDTDIENLDTQSSALLTRITCDIAFIYLAQRRGYEYEDKMPMIQDSYMLLQKLRNGERVLNVAGNEEAGLTATDYIGVVEQAQVGLVTAAYRYFPQGTYPSCCGT